MGDSVPQVEFVKCKVVLPVTAIKQHMLVCPVHDLDDIPLEEVPSTSNQVHITLNIKCFCVVECRCSVRCNILFDLKWMLNNNLASIVYIVIILRNE